MDKEDCKEKKQSIKDSFAKLTIRYGKEFNKNKPSKEILDAIGRERARLRIQLTKLNC